MDTYKPSMSSVFDSTNVFLFYSLVETIYYFNEDQSWKNNVSMYKTWNSFSYSWFIVKCIVASSFEWSAEASVLKAWTREALLEGGKSLRKLGLWEVFRSLWQSLQCDCVYYCLPIFQYICFIVDKVNIFA